MGCFMTPCFSRLLSTACSVLSSLFIADWNCLCTQLQAEVPAPVGAGASYAAMQDVALYTE